MQRIFQLRSSEKSFVSRISVTFERVRVTCESSFLARSFPNSLAFDWNPCLPAVIIFIFDYCKIYFIHNKRKNFEKQSLSENYLKNTYNKKLDMRSRIAYLPLEEAQHLSALLPESKYKKYGDNSYVVYYPGNLLKADRIIAVLNGMSIHSRGKWKLTVYIKFHEPQYLQEQNIKDFLDKRNLELVEECGELKIT